MGLFDSAKDALNVDTAKNLVNEHADKIDAGVGQAADMINEKTGGKFEGQISQGSDFIQDKTGDL